MVAHAVKKSKNLARLIRVFHLNFLGVKHGIKSLIIMFSAFLVGCSDSRAIKFEEIRSRLQNGHPETPFEMCIINAYEKYASSYEFIMINVIESINENLENLNKNNGRSFDEIKERKFKRLIKDVRERKLKYDIDNEYCIKESECMNYSENIYSECMDHGPIWSKLRQ